MTPLMCLAIAIFFEAGVESYDGKLAVADVIHNRVEDERYPNDICSVVFEPKQFSFTHDGKPDALPSGPLADASVAVAIASLSGETLSLSSTHYLASYASASWQEVFDFDGRIGVHLFYTNNTPYR